MRESAKSVFKVRSLLHALSLLINQSDHSSKQTYSFFQNGCNRFLGKLFVRLSFSLQFSAERVKLYRVFSGLAFSISENDPIFHSSVSEPFVFTHFHDTPTSRSLFIRKRRSALARSVARCRSIRRGRYARPRCKWREDVRRSWRSVDHRNLPPFGPTGLCYLQP